MALDLQDQEELENAKRAWKLWGRWLFGGLFLAAIIYIGHNFWQTQTMKKNAEATTILENVFLPKAQANDTTGSLKALQQLQTEYPKSIAALQATLLIASDNFDNGKYTEAENHLLWIKKQHSSTPINMVLTERLVAVYLQQEKYDAAIALLQEKNEPEYAARIFELQGDVYLAQGKKTEAHTAFQAALKALPPKSPAREFIEGKSRL